MQLWPGQQLPQAPPYKLSSCSHSCGRSILVEARPVQHQMAEAASLTPSHGMNGGHRVQRQNRPGGKEERPGSQGLRALNFGPRGKEEASWSSFDGYGEGNVLVSTGERLPTGTSEVTRQTEPPTLTEGSLRALGLSGNVTAKIYIYIYINHSWEGRGKAWGGIRGSGVASRSQSCLPEMPRGWCPSVTRSRSCPLAAGCPKSSEDSPWIS